MKLRDARNITEEMLDILVHKMHDYGTSNITATGMNGLATRLLDKVNRLLTLAKKDGDPEVAESLRDTLVDIANYGVIGALLSDGTWETRPAMVYLAGPIDNVPLGESTGWRKEYADALAEYNIGCFNPVLAYHLGYTTSDEQAKAIVSINRFAITVCDMVVAYLENGLGFGTVREIEYAKSIGKRVIVVSSKALRSLEARDLEVVIDLKELLPLLTE